jgi:glutathione S-transferase
MILVGQYDSPYVRRVAISLHTLGIAFERNTISGFSDAEAMRRINPLGRIPSLILDDGEVLIDSAAILDHLDETVGPERALLPPRGRDRRRALQNVYLATGILDKSGAIVYERTLRPPEKRHEPWIDRCRTQVVSGLAALEAAGLTVGERLTQPVITAGCLIGYLRTTLADIFSPGAYPKLERLGDQVDVTPAFQSTQPSADETMPSRPL